MHLRILFPAALLIAILHAGSAFAAPSFVVEPYLQNPGTDRMTVAWETTDSGNQLEVWKEGFPPQTVPAVRVIGRDIWYASLTGLESNTTYLYRVLTSGGAGATYRFRTWPAAGDAADSAKIVAFSDSQGDWVSRLEDICQTGIIGQECLDGLAENCPEDIAAVLVTGDLVRSGAEVDQYRNEFFASCANLFHYVPILPAIGNHDDPIDNYLAYFILPENGTTGRLEQWYSADLLNLRLITLNSDTLDGQQWVWFQNLLSDSCSDPGVDFVLTQLHHACKSEVWPPGENLQACGFVSWLEDFTFDCGKPSGHLYGHTHAYSRGQSRDVTHLWVNVAVSAGDIDFWGEEPPRDYNEFQVSLSQYGFVVFDLSRGPGASLRMVRRTGGDDTHYYGFTDETISDEFTIDAANHPPGAPQPLYPAGVEVQGASVTLQGSAFSDPDGDFHLESHWQVTTTAGDYATPVADAWGNKTRFQNIYQDQDTQAGVDITSYRVNLALDQTYTWRVRYRDEHFGWSDWSEEASFATVPVPPWSPASTGGGRPGSASTLLNFLILLAPAAALFLRLRSRKA